MSVPVLDTSPDTNSAVCAASTALTIEARVYTTTGTS